MSLIVSILAKSNLTSFQLELARKFIILRKQMKLSRRKLAEESGVTYGSLRRFEESGQISLENLLKLARRTDRLADFTQLFTANKYTSLEELRRAK